MGLGEHTFPTARAGSGALLSIIQQPRTGQSVVWLLRVSAASRGHCADYPGEHSPRAHSANEMPFPAVSPNLYVVRLLLSMLIKSRTAMFHFFLN